MPKDKPYDAKKIKELFEDGLSDREIAETLGHTSKVAWRSVQRIRLKYGWDRRTLDELASRSRDFTAGEKILDDNKDLSRIDFSNMTYKERIAYLKNKFRDSSRFEYMFDSLGDKEVAVFQEEYFSLLRDVDDITLAEEQTLFLAIYELVLALKAQKEKKKEEDVFEECKEGKIKPNSIKYIKFVSDRYDKEFASHIKMYKDYIDSLKLSRSSRLKDVRGNKKSFIDFLNEVSTRESQKSVINIIKELTQQKDDAIQKLIEKKLLLGYFEDDL